MKKHLVLLDTDNAMIINEFRKRFLKDSLTVTLKGIEVWEIDEDNHMEKII